MVVLAIVAVTCFIAGMWAATSWLPPLAEGAVGTLVYVAVSGLAGAVLAVIGIHVWQIVHAERAFGSSPEIVSTRVDSLLWESGTLAALALIAYMLAPKAPPAESK